MINTPLGVLQAFANEGVHMRTASVESFHGPGASGAETDDLFNLSGSGCIFDIQIITAADMAELRKTGLLVLYFDEGLSTAHTEKVPLMDLHSLITPLELNDRSESYDQYRQKIGNDFLASPSLSIEQTAWSVAANGAVDGSTFILGGPMPFTTVRATLKSQTTVSHSANVGEWCNCRWSPDVISTLQWKAYSLPAIDGSQHYDSFDTTIAPDTAYTLFNQTGAGWILGHIYKIKGAGTLGQYHLGFMERNISIAINGETTPSLKSSGTEDYFGSSHYGGLQGSKQLKSGFISYTTGPWGGHHDPCFCAYRHFEVPVRFDSGCVVKLENEPDYSAGRIAGSTGYRHSTILWMRDPGV